MLLPEMDEQKPRTTVRLCPPQLKGKEAGRSYHAEARERTAAVDVAHPEHYARWKMEPIEFIAINNLPWWLANLIKYTMRFDAKDGIKDLYKGRSYLDMKIREVEGHERFWDKPVTEERKLNVGSYTTEYSRSLHAYHEEPSRAVGPQVTFSPPMVHSAPLR